MDWMIGKHCTGCEACVNICPNQCIEMRRQKEHIVPFCDPDKCTGCGLCQTVCPVIQSHQPKAYALYARDESIVRKSSSGGIFTLLAECIINDGGVVFGAAFDDDFSVRHMGIEETQDLDKLRRSKYAQSRIGRTYQEAEEYLLSGRKVLFTGTGCQIQGLISYLHIKGVELKNLYTQDIICHGTVLPEIWEKYLAEKASEYQSPIKSVSFRDKKDGWFDFGVKIEFQNGQELYENKDINLYMKIFLGDMALNEGCYSCYFRGTDRQSDITLADFWSVYRTCPQAFHAGGTSLALVHSQKGKELLSRIEQRIHYEEVDINDIMRNEQMSVLTVRKPVIREKFLQRAAEVPLQQAYEECTVVKFGVFGSFNSRSIAKRCGKVIFQVSNSSIVSLFSPALYIEGEDALKGENEFRNEMLRLDLSKGFLEKSEAAEKIDFLLLDFLEECFGVIDMGDTCVTNSDALHDSGIKMDGIKLDVTEPKFMDEWKTACVKLVDFLVNVYRSSRVILVEMYLSESISGLEVYGEIEDIKKKNAALKEMYSYFLVQCEKADYRINVVKIANSLFYTQKKHKYGVRPEHFSTRAELMGKEKVNKLIMEVYGHEIRK